MEQLWTALHDNQFDSFAPINAEVCYQACRRQRDAMRRACLPQAASMPASCHFFDRGTWPCTNSWSRCRSLEQQASPR